MRYIGEYLESMSFPKHQITRIFLKNGRIFWMFNLIFFIYFFTYLYVLIMSWELQFPRVTSWIFNYPLQMNVSVFLNKFLFLQ